jgi:hypothetical protein
MRLVTDNFLPASRGVVIAACILCISVSIILIAFSSQCPDNSYFSSFFIGSFSIIAAGKKKKRRYEKCV